MDLTPWLRSIAGLRADQLRARLHSLALAANSGAARATQVSPKFTLVAGPFSEALRKTEFFFNGGRGLHSNDARGTTLTTDPKTGDPKTGDPTTGDPADQVPPLAASRGLALGARTEAVTGLQSLIALWQMRSDSELVYIGDAGATEASEASGASLRRGVAFNNRWTPAPWLRVDADLAWTHARFTK